MDISTEPLVHTSTDDDSDVDLVTDFLNSNPLDKHVIGTANTCSLKQRLPKGLTLNCSLRPEHNNFHHQQHQLNAINTASHTIGGNMVPIISVTPHSPGTKYNSILEDTISQLQNIRESVVHMKNSTVQKQSYATCGLIHSSLNSSRIFSSCPSLPDLTAAVNANNSLWSPPQSLQNSDRRKSWTGAEDLTDCTKSSHKSVSLSSLDSEEQESIRVAERLHSRSSRNSTGGISTHSLNEAELARDFERITAKRNLVPLVINRIPLQKSISTPSIAPLRKPGQKEDNNITASRHLSDSEDQDDRSLLSARDKIEVYSDHPEKRRKRGSLFFRKKKDKTKTKGQSTNCDACGAVINLSTCKEHAIECKGKPSKQQSSKSGSGKKGSTSSHTSSHHDDGRDYYDGHNQNDHINYSDDTPLIRGEFLNDPPIGAHDLCADPLWGIAIDEPDSWSPSVAKEIVKSLKDKQVKRQEHIYEFIMTEKHHCQTLLVMKKVFVESLQRHFSRLKLDKLFPRLPELTELHTSFLRKLRIKQKENPIVDSIADILLDFFSGLSAQKLKSAYGEFCSNHRSALDTFKMYMTDDQTFAEWYKHCQQNPLLKKKGIPECILFVTQRLTKYPLLIDPLLKSSREDRKEHEKLQKAMALIKGILVDVDARVAEKEKEDRQLEIFKCIDVKSFAVYKSKQFRKSDLWANRKLKYEGYATLMQGRSKMQNVLVVVLTDCLFFLQESSHNKYTFFTPENKAGVVSLQKLLIREKAGTESRGIYIISSNPAYPEMYELKVQNPKDKNVWIQSIRAAVLECPIDDEHESDDLTAEEKQKLIDAKQATMRELIDKMRQKDIEQAIMLEEKILLQLNLFNEMKGTPEAGSVNAEEFLTNFGTYKDLITDNYCDTVEIWKRVLNTIQEIGQLASSLYTAATGLPVSRSFSSVGERQSEGYTSPILPKRAETFGGFDERRNKSNVPWRDAVLSTLPVATMPTKDNHFYQGNDKRDSIASECDTNSNTLTVYQNNLKIQSENISLKDHNYAALQVSHHLHTLLCIISQQMTTINSLRAQLASYRDNPKTIYKHNDQLEELRNLQDKLQEEKQAWLKQKEQQERELEEQRNVQLATEKQIKADQEDIRQQREQLYRKMEMLYSQGLLLSPNTPLSIANVSPNTDMDNSPHSSDEHHYSTHGTLADKRNEKWRSASINKAPPANLLSATNAPKVNAANVKQQIPMKLSSLSSTKSDKSPNSSNSNNSPINPSGGITQMFPLKLADKKNQNITPNHSRTGSSPAIIQQPIPTHSGNPATRTNTYPKLPERYRVRSSDVGLPLHPQLQSQHSTPTPSTTSMLSTASQQVTHAMKATVQYGTTPVVATALNSSQTSTTGTPTLSKKTISSNSGRPPPASSTDKSTASNPDEEEIYF